jgi:hypothetical protein
MDPLGAIITVVLLFYLLKFVARLMQSDDHREAGQKLDAALDRTASKAKCCVVRGCVWYLVLCVVSLVAGVVLSLIHSLLTGLWP